MRIALPDSLRCSAKNGCHRAGTVPLTEESSNRPIEGKPVGAIGSLGASRPFVRPALPAETG